MSSLVLLAAAVSSLVGGSFDCVIDQVAAVSVDGSNATASAIDGLPAEALKFGLEFKKDKASSDWQNSPIQVSGDQVVLPTGPDAGMILSVSAGPCLFTERGCATMLNFAKQPDGSLKLLVTPTALSLDKERNVRFPFLVSMQGNCSPRKSKT